jgi:RND family efflux transporter MFP subunit
MVNGGILDGSLLTRIVHNTPMFVYFDVDERSLLNYQRRLVQNLAEPSKAGNDIRDRQVPCFMQLQDEKSFKHVGYLDFIENRADAETGTIRVRAVFDNEDQLLTGGLFVRVRIPRSKSSYKAVMIPEQAIVSDQTAKSVFVIGRDNTIERRSIVLGAQKGELRVIEEGLKPGETIVLEGTQKVRVGAKVAPTDKWEEKEATFYQKALANQIKVETAPAQTELPANPSPNSSPADPVPTTPVPTTPASTIPVPTTPATPPTSNSN